MRLAALRAVVASVVVACAAIPAAAGEPDGLVSRFTGDGTVADAQGTNTAAAVGNVTYTAGAVGQGFALDGSSFVQVASPTFDQHRSSFTVAAWIRISPFSHRSPVVNLRTTANASGFTLEQLFGNDGTIVWAVNQSGAAEQFNVVQSAGWKADVLQHVAATFDAPSGSMVLYRDGRAVAARYDLPKVPVAASPGAAFEIGHNVRATDAYWKGLIDDVRFYGRALSPAEVASIARPSSLVAHWRFDEPAGAAVARDDLGTYDGTLSGGAAFVAGGISGNCVTLARATNSLVNMGTEFPGFTSGDFTVSAWIRTTSTEPDAILSKHHATVVAGYILETNFGGYGAPGKANFYVSDPNGGQHQEAISTTDVTDGAWHHVVGTYAAGGVSKIYVDGAPAEDVRPSRPNAANGAPFLIGGVEFGTTPTGVFTGQVDDVQVYASALDDAEVQYLFANPGRPVPAARWDLTEDWSDDANPNGPWTYRASTAVLPRVASWAQFTGSFTAPQPAWAPSAGGNSYLPAWFRSSVTLTDPAAYDFDVGDVVAHTHDPENGVGAGESIVAWTSPVAGAVDVSGAVWMTRDIGRGNAWSVSLNGAVLTLGVLSSGDAFDREHPADLAGGSGGAAALRGLAVRPGDEIRLLLTRTSQYGDLVGARLTVSLPAAPQEERHFLPRKLRVSLKGDGKDGLVATGTFDDGGAAVDWTLPVTVAVGRYSQQFTLTGNAAGTTWSGRSGVASLVVKPHIKGSSRGTFVLKLAKATLGGVIDPSEEVELHLAAAGLPDALSRVRLTNGAFSLAKSRGALVLPRLFPSKVAATANDTKPDAVAFTAGFARGLATPAVLRAVRIALGGTFDRVLPGGQFTRSGDRFSYAEKSGASSLSVVLDFAKQTVTVKSKGIECGGLDGGPQPLLIDVGAGEGAVTVPVRLGVAGTKRTY